VDVPVATFGSQGASVHESGFFDAMIWDQARRVRLYAGDLFILSSTDSTRALIDLARQMLEKAFTPHDLTRSASTRGRKS
jgi:hypothetical protein